MNVMLFINNIATPVLAVMGSTIGLFQIYRGQKEKRRVQAEQIGAWWVRIDYGRCVKNEDKNNNRFDLPPYEDAPQYYVGVALLNQSQTPIRNLAVYGEAYKMKKGKRCGNKRGKTLLLQPILVPGEFISFAVVNNGKELSRPWTYPEELSVIIKTKGKVRPIINDEKWKVDTFIFEDAAGRCWIRRENGKLSRYWFYKAAAFLKLRQNPFFNNDQSLVNPLNYKECFKNDETQEVEDCFKNNKTREVSVYS
ncbi:hypothetical protein ACUYFE_08430 [Olegusella massiliensis]|uniref:hypothetical protein n=1 Tax=Olegusella massiliensis TaxID=1776381 RepID=UPI0040555E3D